MDYLVRAIDEDANIRVFAATTTEMVEKARKIHQTSATASAALGRSLTAGVMMGSMMKNQEDLLTLTINGGGPIGRIVIVSDSIGSVKGYVSNPLADKPQREDGKLDVGAIVGKEGHLSVTMDLGLKEPYVGYSNMFTGEIAEDLAGYYAISEQQPTAISLGVLVDRDLSIKSAGGIIIQLLPGVKDEDIDKIENSLKDLKPISTLIDEGISPEDIILDIFKEFNMKILKKTPIEYKCDCSIEKVKSAIASLNIDEIKSMIEEDKGAEVICHFCNTKHLLEKEDLEKIIVDKN